MKIEILSSDTFTDFAQIVDIYGQGCNYPTKAGVDGFQVDFEIEATNNEGETEQFHIVYQSKERSDNIMAYNGFEMSTAGQYGCDSDESSSLEKFMGYQDGIFDELEAKAEMLCEEWFDAQPSSPVYVYADCVNGNSLVSESDINGVEVDDCTSMDDVRRYLQDMGDAKGEVFERVLKVPAYLVESIDEEYGIN